MPPGQTIQGFYLGESVPVNQKLSDIFLQLHISERSGQGVPTIVDFYGREAYEFRENAISVTIPFDRLEMSVSTLEVTNGVTDGVTDMKGSKQEEDILTAIKNNPFVTYSELSEKLGCSRKTIAKHISKLKEKQRIERAGTNKKGYWKILV